MQAPKTLRRPANWQDFETLCFILWGEIWKCPEIMMNGRSGQVQMGVDIFGLPSGEIQYYGIQCNGKDEYTDKQLSQDEILKEINNARTFEPPLKKLYIATTAIRDVHIQKFVRELNISHRAQGLFEVHVFSWDDIVNLIDSNRKTHDFYVKGQRYKTSKEIQVIFENDSEQITLRPKFKQQNSICLHNGKAEKIIEAASPTSFYVDNHDLWLAVHGLSGARMMRCETLLNLSYAPFHIKIQNSGLDPIEEYKIVLKFEGDIQDISDSNEIHLGLAGIKGANYIPPNVVLDHKSLSGEVIPRNTILVSEDTFTSDPIFIKPYVKEANIKLKWKVKSKDFTESGELIISIRPDIEIKNYNREVDNPNSAGIREGRFEEWVESED